MRRVAAAGEQVGGEGMAQRMRRRGVGQAERAAHARHRQLHDPRRQSAALRADEQRPVGFEREGAEREVVLDRLAHRRDDRRRARLLALADDRDRVRLADRRVGASDRQRLGDAQARAVAERQHRGVARQHPGLARLAFPQLGRGHGLRVGRAQAVGAGVARPWARGQRRARRLFARFRARGDGRAI